MKYALLLLISFPSFAQTFRLSSYTIKMTCGEAVKAGNAKILNRLEPSFWGINDKFVLRTEFENHFDSNETSGSNDFLPEIQQQRKVAYTRFSDKTKFRALKFALKKEIEDSLDTNQPLYACVGHIDVHPFKYSGSHVYTSKISVEEAVKKMRAQAQRHL